MQAPFILVQRLFGGRQPVRERKAHGRCSLIGKHFLIPMQYVTRTTRVSSTIRTRPLMTHVQVSCECGLSFQQEPLQIHRAHDCPLRVVSCIYCGLDVTVRDRGAHQGECGARQASCNFCHSTFLRKGMRH